MRLGLQLGYDDPAFWIGLAEEAERCGFHSVWTSEAYGSDAVSPLAWVGGRTEKIKLGHGVKPGVLYGPVLNESVRTRTARHLDDAVARGGRLLTGGTIPKGDLFDKGFDRLLPRVRSKGTEADFQSPLAAHEAIAYDWLAHGGKRFRPFITLAAYDAATGGQFMSAGAGDVVLHSIVWPP